MNQLEKEAIRYLGYGRNAVDESTRQLIFDVFQELESVVDKRIVYRIFECKTKPSSIHIEGIKIESTSLLKNLNGCDKVILLGATIGAGVDRLLRRYSVLNTARMVVVQACAAALLEEFLDSWQQDLQKDRQFDGWFFRPRFSPGYGDVSITHQKEILRVLDSEKKIGLMTTESGMLTPTKSVTAFLGMSRTKRDGTPRKCETCVQTDCLYRRE